MRLKREAHGQCGDGRAVCDADAELRRAEPRREVSTEAGAEEASSHATPRDASAQRPVPVTARLRGRHKATPISIRAVLIRHVAEGEAEHVVAQRPPVATARKGTQVLKAHHVAAGHAPPPQAADVALEGVEVERLDTREVKITTMY